MLGEENSARGLHAASASIAAELTEQPTPLPPLGVHHPLQPLFCDTALRALSMQLVLHQLARIPLRTRDGLRPSGGLAMLRELAPQLLGFLTKRGDVRCVARARRARDPRARARTGECGAHRRA
jgi:hypothetical protein